MEAFAKPGAAGIIEKKINGIDHILIQERFKWGAEGENGLLEIPAGKIREFENIYDCLRREITEETGLSVTFIDGEQDAVIIEANGYRVLNYTPFHSAQNLVGTYPIMVQTFLCQVEGKLAAGTDETKNIRWVALPELKKLLEHSTEIFYPMHITTLKKYINIKIG